jgi:hypothetical protein
MAMLWETIFLDRIVIRIAVSRNLSKPILTKLNMRHCCAEIETKISLFLQTYIKSRQNYHMRCWPPTCITVKPRMIARAFKHAQRTATQVHAANDYWFNQFLFSRHLCTWAANLWPTFIVHSRTCTHAHCLVARKKPPSVSKSVFPLLAIFGMTAMTPKENSLK